MNVETTLQAIEKYVDDNFDLLCYLYNRWQDEKAYEDINDYGQQFAAKFPEGWKLLKATKRPFGVQVEINGFKCEITINARGFNWKCHH